MDGGGGQRMRLRVLVKIHFPRFGMKKGLTLANEALVWMEAAGKECACAFWCKSNSRVLA